MKRTLELLAVLVLLAFFAAACEPLETSMISTPSEQVSLPDAMDQAPVAVEMEGTGSASGASVHMRIRRLVPEDIAITVPPGLTALNSNASQQDMVVRRSYDPVLLTDDDWHEFVLEAYCLEAHRDNPSDGASLSVGATAEEDVLAVLLAIEQVPDAEGEIEVIQAAIWAITDNISKIELDEVGYELDSGDIETTRTLLEAASLDPSGYRLFRGFLVPLP